MNTLKKLMSWLSPFPAKTLGDDVRARREDERHREAAARWDILGPIFDSITDQAATVLQTQTEFKAIILDSVAEQVGRGSFQYIISLLARDNVSYEIYAPFIKNSRIRTFLIENGFKISCFKNIDRDYDILIQ